MKNSALQQHGGRIANMTELADACGVSRTTLYAYKRRAGFPKPDESGEYSVAEVNAYIDAEQDKHMPQGREGLTEWRIRELQLKCKGYEKQLALQGKLIAVNELAPFFRDFCFLLRNGLIAYINAVCPKIDNDNPVRVIKILRPYLNAILLEMAKWLEQNEVEITTGDEVTPLNTLPAAELLAAGIERPTSVSTTPTPTANLPKPTSKKRKKK